MQANTMYFKVVPQRAGGYNVLCGFNPKLVFSTAERVTSEDALLTPEKAEQIARKHAADLNAADVLDCTTGAVLKKLEKNVAGAETFVVPSNFTGMGIGHYEDDADIRGGRIAVYG